MFKHLGLQRGWPRLLLVVLENEDIKRQILGRSPRLRQSIDHIILVKYFPQVIMFSVKIVVKVVVVFLYVLMMNSVHLKFSHRMRMLNLYRLR